MTLSKQQKINGFLPKKSDQIISLKLSNPKLKLAEVATLTNSSYGYARIIWSKYWRNQLQIRGVPRSPFDVHGWFWWTAVPPKWYDICPVEPSVNRNRQKVWRGQRVSFTLHQRGDCYVYPFFENWREELHGWLKGWLDEDGAKLLIGDLREHGTRHLAFRADGVPKNIRVRIKGVGKFSTDSTPFPSGSCEYEVDPDFLKDIKRLKDENVSMMTQIKELAVSTTELNTTISSLSKRLIAVLGEKSIENNVVRECSQNYVV